MVGSGGGGNTLPPSVTCAAPAALLNTGTHSSAIAETGTVTDSANRVAGAPDAVAFPWVHCVAAPDAVAFPWVHCTRISPARRVIAASVGDLSVRCNLSPLQVRPCCNTEWREAVVRLTDLTTIRLVCKRRARQPRRDSRRHPEAFVPGAADSSSLRQADQVCEVPGLHAAVHDMIHRRATGRVVGCRFPSLPHCGRTAPHKRARAWSQHPVTGDDDDDGGVGSCLYDPTVG